ncbi:MAG: class I adenylate-forming enzyme family protein [Pseudomonadota bacterium]
MDLSEMLARNARRFPDKLALIERTPSRNQRRDVSWKKMDERVNRLANALVARGIGRGDMVIQWMMNSIEWLEVYIGIIRTGACDVPLNFRFTGNEFRYCIDVSEPKAVILDKEFVERIEESNDGSLPLLDYIVVGDRAPENKVQYEELLSDSSPEPLWVRIGPEDPCGLYFTSGTTGAPKPILLTHQNLESAAITEVIHDNKRPGETFVILKPLYHTGDKIHWLSSLILGETAVIQRDKITPKAILTAMHEERGNVAMMLVPWLQDTLTALEEGYICKEDYDLNCWRLVLLGAQPVPPSLIEAWCNHFPHMEYEVNYGLTEASGPGCIHLGIGNGHKLGALGVPGFNWDVRLVDDSGHDVPRGEAGEILVRGNGVMKEYYKNPGKTAEAIRNGWLYTGDMGRMDGDDFIWPCDRKKDIIISGGENVYPAEVEEAIRMHPYVHDVGVMGIPDQRLGEIVGAAVELKEGVPVSAEADVLAYCEDNIARYKRPKRVVFEKVLRNPTGKIEKGKMKKGYFG